jgi:hypothetical protein
LHKAVGPFKEAIDKLILLTALTEFSSRANRPFTTAVAEAVGDDGDTEEIQTRLATMLDEQRKCLESGGKISWPDEYVWDAVIQRLRDDVLSIVAESAGQSDDSTSLQDARPAIQAVGQVTLGIPNPVAPLGTPPDRADVLAVPNVDLPAVSPDGLSQTLRPEPVSINKKKVRQRYGDVGTALFIIFRTSIKQLGRLVTEDGFDLTQVEASELRDALFKRTYGIKTSQGMQQYASPLTTLPVDNSFPGNSMLQGSGQIIDKLLMESFNERGRFIAATYPSDDRDGYNCILHPLFEDSVLDENTFDDPLIPRSVESVRQLWWRRVLSNDARAAALSTQAETFRTAVKEAYSFPSGPPRITEQLPRDISLVTQEDVQAYLDSLTKESQWNRLVSDAEHLEDVEGPFVPSTEKVNIVCSRCRWTGADECKHQPQHETISSFLATSFV